MVVQAQRAALATHLHSIVMPRFSSALSSEKRTRISVRHAMTRRAAQQVSRLTARALLLKLMPVVTSKPMAAKAARVSRHTLVVMMRGGAEGGGSKQQGYYSKICQHQVAAGNSRTHASGGCCCCCCRLEQDCMTALLHDRAAVVHAAHPKARSMERSALITGSALPTGLSSVGCCDMVKLHQPLGISRSAAAHGSKSRLSALTGGCKKAVQAV